MNTMHLPLSFTTITRMLLASLLCFGAQAQGAVCKDVPQRDDYHTQTLCLYANTSLPDAYQRARQDHDEGRYLLPKLPIKKTQIEQPEVLVHYKPLGTNKYHIDFGFEGGNTEWTFLDTGRATKLIIDHYPD